MARRGSSNEKGTWEDRIKTELDGSGSVKKETYKKTIQEIERDMNINTL